MEPIVSIIIPVYNTQPKYLNRCLKSLVQQSNSSFEAIVVDDGSTNDAPGICDKYAKEDSRLFVVHQKNSGVSAARNNGLRFCKGLYCCFLDSDDYIDVSFIEHIVNILEEYKNVDVYAMGYVREIEFFSIKRKCIPSYRGKMAKQKICEELYPAIFWEDKDKTVCLYSVWSKCIRRSLIENNNIRFPEGWNHAEDANFSIRCFALADSILFDDYAGYHYMRQFNFRSLSTQKRLDFFALELRYRRFLEETLGQIINQSFSNPRGWKSMLEKAERNAIALCRNGKKQEVRQWLEYIYNSDEYRSAVINLSEDEMTAFQKQQKRIVMSSDMESWIQLMYIHAKGERWNGLKNSLFRWV